MFKNETEYLKALREVKFYEAQHDTGRPGVWMPTLTGKRYWLEDPQPDDFDIDDIAIPLSRIPRWNGQTSQFISVAEHSVMVCLWMIEDGLGKYALAGLFHDCSEAYLGDVISPVKHLLPEFKQLEEKCLEAASRHFGFPWDEEARAIVKKYDDIAWVTELSQLVPVGAVYHRLPVAPRDHVFDCWSPESACTQFLDVYASCR